MTNIPKTTNFSGHIITGDSIGTLLTLFTYEKSRQRKEN